MITSINIQNPNIKSYNYEHMFLSIVLYGISQITVNYIAETNSLVNGMINTKSSSAKVVKGEPLD